MGNREDYQPFKNLKVIELASVLAGPSVGMFFAELGAKVIKVENPKTGGDVTRSWKLASEDPHHPYSAYYASVNWGKEVWMLDLKSEEGLQKVLKEIETADIVISNFRPSSAEKLGLDHSSLKRLNPNLIYGEILGFRAHKRLAYDVVLQAECGFISINGSEPGDETKWPLAIIDLFAAHQLKEGLLLALWERERSGKAAYVSASLFEAGLATLTNQATNWLMANHDPQPMGSLHPNIAPYGETFSCNDGKKIILAVGSNTQFKALCSCLKLEGLAESELFKDNHARLNNRQKLQELLDPAFKKFNRDVLMESFMDKGVPAGAIRSIKEVFELEESRAMILKEIAEERELIAVKGKGFKIEF